MKTLTEPAGLARIVAGMAERIATGARRRLAARRAKKSRRCQARLLATLPDHLRRDIGLAERHRGRPYTSRHPLI